MIDETRRRQRFEAVRGQLDERGLRLMAAAEARAAGYGGIAAVARTTGIARSTIGRGVAGLAQPPFPPGQAPRAGSGRKPVREKDPTLLADLRRLVEPATHGDPMRPLLWVSKSHAKLADALYAMGPPISPNTVGKLLREDLGYSRRTNRKTLEGARHPDRDSQFAHINARACAFREAGQPVISVDTKKKELIGPFTNGGSDDRPKGSPEAVNVHDFADQTLGKVAPYGIYDRSITAAGSAWASTMTRPSSRSTPSGPGMSGSGACAIGGPIGCRSRPIAAAPMERGFGCGRLSCRSWPTRPA